MTTAMAWIYFYRSLFIFQFIRPRCPKGGGLNITKKKKERCKAIHSHSQSRSHSVTYRCVASCPVRGTFSSRASADRTKEWPCHSPAISMHEQMQMQRNAALHSTTAHNIRGAGVHTKGACVGSRRLDKQSGNLQRSHAHRCKWQLLDIVVVLCLSQTTPL